MKDVEECINSEDYLTNIDPFEAFALKFRNVIDRHAPQKSKVVRGNDGPFMTAALRKEMRYRSKLSKLAKNSNTEQSKRAFRKQRNKCTSLLRKCKREYFERVTESGGKRFWQAIQGFVSEKGSHGNDEYILEENGNILKEPEEISEIFNEYFTNILKHSTGNDPIQIPLTSDSSDIIEDILSYYGDHESILSIKQKYEK